MTDIISVMTDISLMTDINTNARSLIKSALPTCELDGCEQPWQRVEIRYEYTADGDWVPVAVAVCEYGHVKSIDPV